MDVEPEGGLSADAVAARERRGAALIALYVILAITAAWWALALWPAGEIPPEWLARTRGACFGTGESGLPSAGGWVLLIGEPIGMVGLLLVIGGGSLRADLQRAWQRWWGRTTLLVSVAALVTGAALSGVRVAAAMAARSAPVNGRVGTGTVTLPGTPLSTIALIDQHGTRAPIVAPGAARTLVTFAFGECEAVCPTAVHDLLEVRDGAGRPDVPIVVVTLDPWRDTPDRLATIARHWGLASNDRVLSGSIAEVESLLDAVGVHRARNQQTGNVDHLTTVLVVSADSRILWRGVGGGRAMMEGAGSMLAGTGS
ncbi:MAG TPA: SCO family protein [Gemmatimonadaceae bacterium]|nr:SCO family protein [Gemmatimonadaceae bacterium]